MTPDQIRIEQGSTAMRGSHREADHGVPATNVVDQADRMRPLCKPVVVAAITSERRHLPIRAGKIIAISQDDGIFGSRLKGEIGELVLLDQREDVLLENLSGPFCGTHDLDHFVRHLLRGYRR